MFERMLRQPMAIVLGMLLLAVGGLARFAQLPVDLFPRLDYPLINVVSHDPAGTAVDMERLVTRPIESAMLGLPELLRLRSTSTPGFSQVTVEFHWGVSALQARQLVAARLAAVSLPNGVRSRLENIGTSLAMVSTYTLSGGDPLALRTWAEYRLAPRLTALPGVARIQVMGGAPRAWRIDVDPLALQSQSLSTDAIGAAVRAANVLATGGHIERHGRDLLVSTDARLRTLDDLKAVTVAHGPDGRPVRLADVAHVYAGFVPQRYVIAQDDLPAIALLVQKQPGASTLAVSRAVDAQLARLKLPSGARLTKFYDQAEIIAVAYRNMRNNLLAGSLLAMLALLLILGSNRTSLIVACSFPLAVLGTFWAMAGLDLGLNLMTLGALTVAIGMLADDAIVVLENIDRHRLLGKPPRRAALDGLHEVLGADVAGTLTVLAAFAPLLAITGFAGRLARPFGTTFSLLLGFSLLVSVTLIPLAASRWMPRGALPGSLRDRPGERLAKAFERFNLRLLERLLRHRKATLTAAPLLLAGSLALLMFNPVRLLPLLDEHSLLLSYELAPGTALGEGNRVGAQLARELLALPDVRTVYRRTGSPDNSFYPEGAGQGELVVRLTHGGEAEALSTKSKVERLLAATPGVLGRVNEPTSEKLDESFSGLPGLFGISLYGNDLKALYRAALRVEAAASRVPGLADVTNNTKIPIDQLRVRVDRTALARYRVKAKDLARAVTTAMQGETIDQVIVDQRPVAIFLRYPDRARRSVADLERVLVPEASGGLIPLSQVAGVGMGASYPTIEHQHGVRALTLTAEIDGNPLSVIAGLDRTLSRLSLPDGISWGYTGEYGSLLQMGRQLLWALLAATLLVYGILAVQLGTWLDPLVILVKLPLDFTGAALALFITRQGLDLTVAIGFITLVAVSTNNALVLLTFVRKLRRQGLDVESALRAAVRLRSRPMLLTQLTTLLALVPAALGLGTGPQVLQALGIMLFGGLGAGTLFTLNLVPVIYAATERWRRVPAVRPGEPAAAEG
jgi:CzcA family heavy metal efflux pump